MPEYLAPGVYVVEVAQGAKPIDGVSTSTALLVGSNVIKEVQRLTDQLHPGNKPPDKDLAVALIELLAWAADTLACRLDELEDEAWLPTAGLSAAALKLTTKVRSRPAHGAIKRINYFEGQLLEAGDLDVEVDYARSKHRPAFTPGIVSGLEVTAQAGGDGLTVKVSPGKAVDSRGHLIVLNEMLTLMSPLTAKRVCVIMRPERGRPRPILLRASAGRFLIAEQAERDDLVLECVERTPRGWRVKKPAAVRP